MIATILVPDYRIAVISTAGFFVLMLAYFAFHSSESLQH